MIGQGFPQVAAYEDTSPPRYDQQRKILYKLQVSGMKLQKARRGAQENSCNVELAERFIVFDESFILRV